MQMWTWNLYLCLLSGRMLSPNYSVKVKLLSHVWLFATPWTVAHQASPSMGFSRQEYWSGLPFPSPEIFLTQGLNSGLPLGKPWYPNYNYPVSKAKEGFASDKESACNTGDMVSIPGLGRSPGGGNGNPVQYSFWGNLMDGGVWWATHLSGHKE